MVYVTICKVIATAWAGMITYPGWQKIVYRKNKGGREWWRQIKCRPERSGAKTNSVLMCLLPNKFNHAPGSFKLEEGYLSALCTAKTVWCHLANEIVEIHLLLFSLLTEACF